jgi:tetratricopeptide (TPR) repeat protein
MLIDWSLVITIAFIFLVTLAGAWLRSRRRDPCLVAFEGYHVTLEEAGGKLIWGALRVKPTGLELLYRQAVQDEGHIEASYLLYSGEYQQVQAIYRYADVLDAEASQRRSKDLHHWFHPGPLRYLLRKLRAFVTTASESLNEVIGLLLGRARKQPAGAILTDTSAAYIKKFGGDLIGQASGANDPMLEQFIGRRVVVEIGEDNESHEHVGILKNYSPDFLELLDVQFPFKQSVPIEPQATIHTDRITAVATKEQITVNNHCNYPVLVQSLQAGGETSAVYNVIVDAGETVNLPVEAEIKGAELRLQVIRELDMIVPRSRCIIRHRAALIDESRLPDIVFDLGVMLRAGDRDEAREKRLREQLDHDPNNALAAANLGALLVQRQEFGEAEYWLQQALALRGSLPDRGRRAEMQMRELQRRNAATVAPPASEFDARVVRLDVTKAPATNGARSEGDGNDADAVERV